MTFFAQLTAPALSQSLSAENNSTRVAESENALASGTPMNWEGVTPVLQKTLTDFFEEAVARTPFILSGLFVLIVTWGLAKLATVIATRTLRRSKMRGSLKDLIYRSVNLVVWMIGMLIAFMIIFPGVTPASLLGTLGIASIAVGLAFKDIFENFFAGVLLLWRFPFENEDYIECNEVMGRVKEIELRMTVIERVTGELVVMPNATLLKNSVDILTHQSRRRITVSTGIAYGENITEALKVIEDGLSNAETIDRDKPLQVWPTGFGASSIDIDVTYWTGAKPVEQRRSRGEVVTLIKSALDKAGIEIPFPHRTLTFKEPLQIEQQ